MFIFYARTIVDIIFIDIIFVHFFITYILYFFDMSINAVKFTFLLATF